jgi:hypothetical protein
MTEWQPIETAPRDGVYILLTQDHIAFLPEIGSYREKTKDKIIDGNLHIGRPSGWFGRSGVRVAFEPTHWMPLPPPPKTESL